MSFLENDIFDSMEVEEAPDEVTEEAVEVDEIPDGVKFGLVSCNKLNVRESPDKKATIICVIDKGKEVTIYEDESTFDWYYVSVDQGVNGFCMKEYVEIVDIK